MPIRTQLLKQFVGPDPEKHLDLCPWKVPWRLWLGSWWLGLAIFAWHVTSLATCLTCISLNSLCESETLNMLNCRQDQWYRLRRIFGTYFGENIAWREVWAETCGLKYGERLVLWSMAWETWCTRRMRHAAWSMGKLLINKMAIFILHFLLAKLVLNQKITNNGCCHCCDLLYRECLLVGSCSELF